MLGIREHIWSVFDLDRAIQPLVELGGYQRVSLPDGKAEQWSAFGLRQACTRIEQCVLVPIGESGDRRGIRVVRFHGVEQTLTRPSQHIWDSGGTCGLDMMCSDTRGLYARLEREHGFTSWGEPVTYDAGNIPCTLVVALGPSGIALGLLQVHGAAIPPEDQPPLSWAFNSAHVVADLERGQHFFAQILGWKLLRAEVIDDAVEPGHQVLGIPMPFARTTPRHIVVYAPGDAPHSSAEMFHTPALVGTDFSGRAVAPNVGLLGMRVCVDDVIATHARITARGGIVSGPPEQLDDAHFGAITRFVVRSPDGALMEMFSQI